MAPSPAQRLARDLDLVARAGAGVEAALDGPPSVWDRPALAEAAAAIGQGLDALSTSLARFSRASQAGDGDPDGLGTAARTTLAAGPGTRALLERLDRHAPSPLFPPEDPDDPASEVIARLALGFAQLERIVTGVEQSEEMEADAYRFIPMDPAGFMRGLRAGWRILAAQGRAETGRFLDVGAGAGTKLLLAGQVFPEADGIELDPLYLGQVSRVLRFAPGRGEVREADALAFEGYGRYDFIYVYHPLSSRALENRLEARILAQARPGTVIFAPRIRPTVLHGRPQIAPAMVVAGEGVDLAGLRAEAERIGLQAPPPRPRNLWNRHNRLLPALKALWRAGFGVQAGGRSRSRADR